jgi:hypothetical protein
VGKRRHLDLGDLPLWHPDHEDWVWFIRRKGGKSPRGVRVAEETQRATANLAAAGFEQEAALFGRSVGALLEVTDALTG